MHDWQARTGKDCPVVTVGDANYRTEQLVLSLLYTRMSSCRSPGLEIIPTSIRSISKGRSTQQFSPRSDAEMTVTVVI